MQVSVKVSVIVPVYNVEEYLSKCLDSIIDQDFDGYEVICVDDCTPDGSSKILNEYQNKYPDKIRIITNERNLGAGISRNRGIEMARGDYIMFIDSDDYVKHDYIKKYYESARETNVDVVIGGYIRVSGTKQVVHVITDNIWATLTYGITWAKMYKKEFWTKNDLQFETYKFDEDVHLNACAFCCGMTYAVIPYEGYYYLDNGKSTTNTADYEKDLENIVMDIFTDVLEKYGQTIDCDKRNILGYVCYVNLLNVLMQFNKGCGIALMKRKYAKCRDFMNIRFPGYIHNPYLKIGGPKGQTAKIRIATGVTMLMRRFYVDLLIFYVIAILK